MYLCLKFFSVPLLYSFIVQSRIARKIKRFVTRTLVYNLLLFCNNRPFHTIFQVLIKTRQQISIDTAGKSSLKFASLPSLKVIRQKRAEILLRKVAKQRFYRHLYGGVHKTCPHHTLYKCKIQCFCRAMSLLFFNKSCSNLASLLILQCSSEVLSLV